MGEAVNRSEASHAQRREYSRQYRLRNKAYFAEYERTWRKSHPAERMVKASRQRARRLGLEHTITAVDLGDLPRICPALGIEIDYGRDTWGDNSPSIDRIDNARGYVPGNVVVVSMRANRLKSNASTEELCRLAVFYRGL